ncbi:dioxygenase family protein [Pontibacter burrus]|uniref:Intradiol ring-cleavage dioxygenase n=1 Tax=Pontibacter burrus TaxID=2704466 RepID=A0A6B3LY72_9BACT|nr:intradiol ring-cleavage dioxygenase [Pontibacter burrus]NEM98441.1 intradiol ring-cleavage dioxygenase [Pontibacter burrus]
MQVIHRNVCFAVTVVITLVACQESTQNLAQREPATHLPADTCNNPDAHILCCYEYIPETLTSTMKIAGDREHGEKLRITGTIYKADGKTPYPDVVLYVYQTDDNGYYSKAGNEKGFQKWHGRLHGWCKTDARGFYEIRTIRPARYPDNSMPANIHAAIKKPDTNQSYYVSDFVFKDDSLVNASYLKTITSLVGGTGILDVRKLPDSTWVGKRDIILTK